jgi:hypothetical protein
MNGHCRGRRGRLARERLTCGRQDAILWISAARRVLLVQGFFGLSRHRRRDNACLNMRDGKHFVDAVAVATIFEHPHRGGGTMNALAPNYDYGRFGGFGDGGADRTQQRA